MVLLSSRDAWWVSQCDAALEALGLVGHWAPIADFPGALELHVPDLSGPAVTAMLSDLMGEELLRAATPPDSEVASEVNIFWRPAFATSLSSALLMVVFFVLTGDAASGGVWQRRGGLVRELVLQGHQWFRLVTAATLHADWGHAMSNAGFTAVLGWAAGERLGSGMAAAVWLITAWAGFALSLAGSDIHATIGASGGLFGLLGSAAGHALRYVDVRRLPRRRRQVLGAALMLLAMTAFNPESNRWAHLGGFVTGLSLGAALPKWGRWGQLAVGLGVALVLVWAWVAALGVSGRQMD